MHPRVQWMIILQLVVLALVLCLLILAKLGYDVYLTNARPVLTDALRSPYALEGRAVPMSDAEGRFANVLPDAVGVYTVQMRLTAWQHSAAEAERLAEIEVSAQQVDILRESLSAAEAACSVLQPAISASEAAVVEDVEGAAVADASTEQGATASAEPVIDAAALEAARIAVETAKAELAAAQTTLAQLQDVKGDRVGNCLLSAGADSANSEACLTSLAYYTERADYGSGGTVVHATAGLFNSDALAARTIKELYQYARQIGRTGDYTFGIVESDYFYSSGNDLFSFAWSNGPWLYVVSSQSFQAMEQAVRAFPY